MSLRFLRLIKLGASSRLRATQIVGFVGQQRPMAPVGPGNHSIVVPLMQAILSSWGHLSTKRALAHENAVMLSPVLRESGKWHIRDSVD